MAQGIDFEALAIKPEKISEEKESRK